MNRSHLLCRYFVHFRTSSSFKLKYTYCERISNEFTQRLCHSGSRKYFSKKPFALSRSIDEMKADGDRFVQSAGVELKFENDEDLIDWDLKFGLSDILQIVKRCMSKYPAIVPTDLSNKRVEKLVRQLKGFDDKTDPTNSNINEIVAKWNESYLEHLEKVTFDSISSYEP